MLKIKIFIAFLLVLAVAFSFCACKSKKEDETSSSSVETLNVPTTVNESAEEVSSEETTQVTTQTTQATLPTEQPTQTEGTVTETYTNQEPVTETVVPTGVETVKDGSKTIVFPAALRVVDTTYPIISWANGTGCPTQLYSTLIEAIANAGYIVVADDDIMTQSGTSQIDSINYIINKNSDSSSVFYNKVNTSAIGVCGQSQGGRSSINAAQKDSRIRAVVSIAGASTAEEAKGLKTPCLFLTATNDNIVKSESWCLPSYNAVAGRAAYASLKGGNHLSFNSMSGYTVDWFNAYLKNDSTARAVFTDGGKLSSDGAWQDFKNKN